MGSSLAGERGWGSSNAEESVVDPEEESVEESLDDSSLEDSPGSLFLFWGCGLGALLGSRLGGDGVWVWVWVLFGGLGGGSGVGVARAGHTRVGGGPLRPLVGSAAALGTCHQCCPTPRCALRERYRGLPRSPSWP